MINFYEKVDRLFKIQAFLIKKHIINEDGIDYDLLKKLSDDLSYQSWINHGFKAPVFSKLYNDYKKGLNIDESILEPNLFLSECEKLAEEGIIQIIEEKDNWVNNPILKIIDERGFLNYTSKIKKQFAFLILYKKRMTLLKLLLDDISKKGPFNNAEIQRIYNIVQDNSVKMQEYLKQNNSKKLNENPPPIGEIHKTFYLDIVRKQPRILINNNEFMEALALLKSKKLICVDTNLEQFSQIFKSTALEETNLIKWTGDYIELKWLIQAICTKGVCSHLKGKQKWLVALHCFSKKNKSNGKWEKIQFYTQISNASGSDKNKPSIIQFGEILKFL
jgi:hypothetical protein